MFYSEEQAINACTEIPSRIFDLIREDHLELVDKILSKKIVPINTTNEKGNTVLMVLLKKKEYELVLKHMKNKEWDINHQNDNGDTFAHILATTDYIHAMNIIKGIMKNKKFIPNIKNNKGETILDRSIENSYIYTTVKILEDERFNNIDIVSFKHLYDTYINSNKYGKYTKLTNLEMIVDNLEDKLLLPRVKELIDMILKNFEVIKNEILNNGISYLDNIVSNTLNESRA